MARKTDRRVVAASALITEALEDRMLYSAAEPNNSFAQAYTPSNNIYLEQNLVDSDSVSTATDGDDYRKFYNLYGKSQLYTALNGLTGDADLYVYDQNMNLLGSSTKSGNQSETLTVNLPANQYFYVRVKAYSGSTNYNLYLYNDYAGSTTSNPRDIGVAWGQGSDKFWNYNKINSEDYLDYRDNVDVVKFQMEAAGTASIRMKDFTYSGGLVAKMELLNAGGSVLATTSGTVGNGLNFDRISLPAGSYFVRFTQISGSDPYTFRVVSDYAGDTTATARQWGDATGSTRRAFDMVGGPFGLPTYEDSQDLYKFTLTQTAPVNLNLQIAQGLTAPTFDANLRIARDTNNDGFIQSSEFIAQSNLAGNDSISTTLGAGTYYAVVVPNGAYTSYQLDLNSDYDYVAPQPWKNMTKARDLGTLFGEKSIRDGFGYNDFSDFFKFKMDQSGTFTASAVKEWARDGTVSLAVVRDLNNNGILDAGETVATGTVTNGVAKVSANLAAGTYFIQALGNGGQTGYLLRSVADYAGGSLPTARVVGALSSTVKVFNDYIEQPGFGGDNSDVYKFTLGSAKTVTAKTTGVAGEDLVLQLIRDVNNNGVIDAGDVFAASDVLNSPNETLIKNLAAGTYFARVAGVNGGTNYSLSLKTN